MLLKTEQHFANRLITFYGIGLYGLSRINFRKRGKKNMEELKNKFIEAMKSIDFSTLTIYELNSVAEIAEKVDKMAKRDYTDMLAETVKGFSVESNYEKPKTIGEMKGE